MSTVEDRLAALEAENAQLRAQVSELVGKARAAAGDGLVVKDDRGEHLVFGWWYQAQRPDGSQVVDWSGDIVDDPAELEKSAYQFMLNRRTGDVEHNGQPVATVVESMVFTPDKAAKMGIPAGIVPAAAWWGGLRITSEDVWDRVRAGDLRAFSIGGKGRREALD